ncbi:MAG TPA: hypothetical protein V6D20_20510 [Candidatus Obscuribacterales bacterium]
MPSVEPDASPASATAVAQSAEAPPETGVFHIIAKLLRRVRHQDG